MFGAAAPLQQQQRRVVGQLALLMGQQGAHDPAHRLRRRQPAGEVASQQLDQPLDAEEVAVRGPRLSSVTPSV